MRAIRILITIYLNDGTKYKANRIITSIEELNEVTNSVIKHSGHSAFSIKRINVTMKEVRVN